MTACRNKASRAVTAALVGVLSVGAVPMVALASPAVANNGGASLMLGGETLAGGTILEAYDDNLDPVDLDGTYTIAYDGDYHSVKPTIVKSAVSGDELKVDGSNVKWGMYKVDPSGVDGMIGADKVTWVGTNAKEPGTYYAAAFVNGDSGPDKCALVKFQIVMTSLDGAYVCDGTDADDKVIEYDGTDQYFYQGKLNIAVDGEVIPYGDFDSVIVYKSGDATLTNVPAHEAGSYVARVKYNGDTRDIPFEVVPFDITGGEVELDKGGVNGKVGSGLPENVTAINGVSVSDLESDGAKITLTYQDGIPGAEGPGEYKYSVSVKDDKGNVKGSIDDVVVTRYTKDATFSYDGNPINSDSDTDGVFNYDAGNHFVAEYVKARGDKTLATEISYEQWDGSAWKPVTEAKTAEPGSYRAKVTAVDGTHAYGGYVYVEFETVGETVNDADIYLFYKGEVVNTNIADVYNGEDFLDDFTMKAYDEDGELIDASQFVITATENKKAVDSIVDEGTYTIEVKPAEGSGYVVSGAGTYITFTVDPVKATYSWTADGTNWVDTGSLTPSGANAALRLAGAPSLFGKANTYAYTGEAVTPTFEYDVNGAGYATDYSATEWVSLPSDAYRATYTKWDADKHMWVEVDECVEAGNYQVYLADNKRDDNYNVKSVLSFTISNDDVFVDVDPDAYYAESVYQANKQGYVYGMGGTNMFAPNASMSRADMAVMLFRMAGGELRVNDGKFDVDMGYVTKFEDCDENAYYAKAVAWATQVGIVSGYDATHFGPADKVTTEQFAVMLANYAKAAGKYEKVDVDATLAKVSDGSSVSAFAREQVAWAVDNGYIAMGGAAISPQAEISRGRVVTIAVRYQPEVSSIVAEKPGDSNLPGNESGNTDQKN